MYRYTEARPPSTTGGGVHSHHVHYIDALRERRPRLMMLAADCDPVIPPLQVAATAAAVGGEYVCFGDGPKPKSKEASKVAAEGAVEGAAKESDVDPLEEAMASMQSMMTDGREHFSHYDLLCGRRAPEQVYPVVTEFINRTQFFLR